MLAKKTAYGSRFEEGLLFGAIKGVNNGIRETREVNLMFLQSSVYLLLR